jgi:hypothetical protein
MVMQDRKLLWDVSGILEVFPRHPHKPPALVLAFLSLWLRQVPGFLWTLGSSSDNGWGGGEEHTSLKVELLFPHLVADHVGRAWAP